MEYKKITAEDIAGKGVVGQADTPLLSALEMQNKVEEVPRAVIIPHFNSLIDSLDKRDADVDTALSDRYTKTETDKAIGDKLTEIGAGDMQKAVYDTDGDGVVDNAEKLAVARKIGSAAFDGTKDISLEQMGAIPKTDGTALQPTFSWAMSDGGRVELRRAGNEGQYGLSLILAKGDGTKEYFSLVTSNTEGQSLGLAQKYHTHTASQIASGALPVERGGTGAANASGALANLGAMPTAGGIFTGEVRADSGASVNARLRNIMVNSSAGAQVSTNFIYMKRK